MDAIIFDIDGTLWDARSVIADSWNEILKSYDVTEIMITKELCTSLFGKSIEEIAGIIFPNLDKAKRLDIMLQMLAYENEYLLTHSGTVYEGIEETVQALYDKYPLYIVSNCGVGYIEVFLKTTGLTSYFKGHISNGDTGLSKGKNIKKLMDTYHLTNPIYIGDVQGDADACKEAGIPIIYASYGFGIIEKPSLTISAPIELLTIL